MQEDFEDDIKASQTDANSAVDKTANKSNEEAQSQSKADTDENATSGNNAIVSDSTILDLLDIATLDEPNETDCLLDIFSNATNGCKPTSSSSSHSSQPSSNLLAFDFLKKMQGSTAASESNKKGVINKGATKMNDKKTTAWMDLFADLDPLANPITMEKKIAGSNQNWLDA